VQQSDAPARQPRAEGGAADRGRDVDSPRAASAGLRLASALAVPPLAGRSFGARDRLAWRAALLAERLGWLATALFCLALSYFVIWQRGPYLDDYVDRMAAVDVTTGQWRPWDAAGRIPYWPARPLHWTMITTFGALLWTDELLVRAVLALAVGINALLLGWLIYRLLGSRLAAVIGGWVLVAPFFAHEAVLWVAASGFVYGATFALLCLHCVLSGLRQPRWTALWALAGGLVFTVALLWMESYASATGLVPLFALLLAAQRPRETGPLLRRALLLLLGPLAGSAAVYLGIYHNSFYVASRGGVDLSPAGLLERAVRFVSGAGYKTLWPDWGLAINREAFGLGLGVALSSWPARLLLLGAAVALAATVLAWRSEREVEPAMRTTLVAAAVGLAWSLGTLFFPGILVRDAVAEYRQLYFPLAGVGLAVGSLAWLLARRLGGASALLGLAGCALLLSSLCMLGYARAYQARAELDRQQLQALAQAAPGQLLPPDTFIAIVDADEDLFGGRQSKLGMILAGVFETLWSAYGGMSDVYHRDDVWPTTASRWEPLRFHYEERGPEGAPRLDIQDRTDLPIERTLLARYHAGRVVIAEQIVLDNPDGSRSTLRFPLAEMLKTRGTPTIEQIVAKNAPAT